jgi:hypothetical protein
MAGDFADIPYVQAAHFGGTREMTKIVVIHATDNTASDEGEVAYEAHRPDSVSAHFTNDEDSIYQSVPLARVAYGCNFHGNHMSIQFELCGLSNQLTDTTMRTAALTVRRVCNKFGIPIRKISSQQVRDAWYSGGQGGICGHGDVTRAFPEDKGTHTDPGNNFPWASFIEYVMNPTGGDDMGSITDPLQAAELGNAEHYLQALVGLTDTANNISNVVQGDLHVPNVLATTLKKIAADVGELKNRQVTVTLTDAQVAAEADRITAALIARPDNPLDDSDKPAIVAAVKQALREGSGA